MSSSAYDQVPPTAPTPVLAPPTLPVLPQTPAPVYAYRYEPEVLPQPEPDLEPPALPAVPRPSQSTESIPRPSSPDWGSPWNEAPRSPEAPATPATPETPYTDAAYASAPVDDFTEGQFSEGQTTEPVENDWRDVPRYQPPAVPAAAEPEPRPLLDPGMPLEATRAQQITPGKRRR